MRHELCFNAGIVLNKRYYFGDFERDISGGVTRDIHYIGGDGLNCIIEKIGSTTNFYYVYKDYLGSILTVTNASGSIVDERNYDAWGKNRNPTDWTYTNIPTASLNWLTRGYTGHEHLVQFGLINMNGRLYDPILGRMLSPDNYTHESSQGYNRYSYAMNNPLKYTDPSGQDPLLIGGMLIGAGISVITNGITNMQHGQSFFKGAFQAAITGLVASAFSMGIGEIAMGIGNVFLKATFQAAAHGIIGGVMSMGQGSNFMSGAASGAVSSIIGTVTAGYGKEVQLLAGGLSGGIASSLAGGNFWDGVRQGLITTGLNHAAHQIVNEIELFVWRKQPTNIRDIGHVALKIGKKVYGYYPTDHSYLYTRGKMTIFESDSEAFMEQYSGEEIDIWNLKISANSVQNIEKYLLNMREFPGNYSLLGRNCTSVAIEALASEKIYLYTNTTGITSDMKPLNAAQIVNGFGVSPSALNTILGLLINGQLAQYNSLKIIPIYKPK
jgi:RHS repeat-associated protein